MNNTTKMGARFPQEGMTAGLELRFNPADGRAGPANGPVEPGVQGYYIILGLRYGTGMHCLA